MRKRSSGAEEAGEDGEAERDFRRADDAQHGDVVEGVEVVFGDAALAGGLVEVDALVGQADFGDDAAEVGVGVVEAADEVDDLAGVEAEAGVVLDGFDGGEALDGVVVLLADPVQEAVLAGAALDAEDHLVAVFPGCDHLGDEVGRLLEVGGDADHDVSAGLHEGVDGGADVAEVAGVDDDFDVAVGGRDALEDGGGGVGGGLSMKMCS